MNEFNTYEYTVAQKIEGKWKLARAGLITGYVLYVVILLFVGIFTRIIVPLLALIPVTLWMIVFCTWRYVKVEYEYSITSGIFTLSNVYGNRSRKKMLEIPIKDMTVVAPYNSEFPDQIADADEKIQRFAPEVEHKAVSSFDSPDVYYALYSDKNTGERGIIWFEATEKALKIFKFYNSTAAVVSKVRF